MLSINEMTDLDYAILEKLAQSAMLESVLLNTFPQPAVAKHRLNLLMHSEYEDLSPWGGMPTPRPDSYYVQESASKLELSPHGWKTLEDWHLQKKKTCGMAYNKVCADCHLHPRSHCGDNIAITIPALDTPRAIRDITNAAKSSGCVE